MIGAFKGLSFGLKRTLKGNQIPWSSPLEMGVAGTLFDCRREMIWEAIALLPKLGYFSL